MDGLTLHVKCDGTWLEFRASSGKTATLRIETLAENRIGIRSKALRDWCQDRQAEVAHACPRCGERIENGLEPDGCRDPDCPEMNPD